VAAAVKKSRAVSVPHCAMYPGELRRDMATCGKARAARALPAATWVRLSFRFEFPLGRLRHLGASFLRKLEAKKIKLRKSRVLLAGSACTWARLSTVIKIERSKQETRPSGASKSSEPSERSGVLRYFVIFFCTKYVFKTKSSGATRVCLV